MTIEKLRTESMAKIAEANFRAAIMERSDGLSEVTGRPGEVIHHILGRGKPKGFKNLPLAIKEIWPHHLLNGIMLTRAEHEAAHRYSKMMRVLLLNLLLLRYGDTMLEDRTCREWLNEPPFVEWL